MAGRKGILKKTNNMEVTEQMRLENLSLLEQLTTGQDKIRSILESLKHAPTNPLATTRSLKKSKSLGSPQRKATLPQGKLDSPNVSVIKHSPSSGRTKQSPSQKKSHSNGLDTKPVKVTTPTKAVLVPEKETPKSILKRRKIIEDNVKVTSDYAQSPSLKVTPKRRTDLNFSYQDEDDANYTSSNLNGSYLGETPEPPGVGIYNGLSEANRKEQAMRDLREAILEARDRKREQDTERQKTVEFDPASELGISSKDLLLDKGNERRSKSVTDLSKKPKSFVLESTLQSSPTVVSGSKKSEELLAQSTVDNRSHLLQGRGDYPLLGYDWIAGLLDTETSLAGKTDDFFKELSNFRKTNRDICSSKGLFNGNLDIERPISPEVSDPKHTCIHGYSINNRLFTEPIACDEKGQSMCTVCLQSRKPTTEDDPGFVRVSIPRSTLEKPYKVKPHRRRSFDPTDSYALSEHCLAGWQDSKPNIIPPAAHLDIKQAVNGLKTQLETTNLAAELVAHSYSRSARNLSSTKDLLDASYPIDFQRDRINRNPVPVRTGCKKY